MRAYSACCRYGVYYMHVCSEFLCTCMHTTKFMFFYTDGVSHIDTYACTYVCTYIHVLTQAEDRHQASAREWQEIHSRTHTYIHTYIHT
jgi:hypothetical protein